jgi:hypothetical protein
MLRVSYKWIAGGIVLFVFIFSVFIFYLSHKDYTDYFYSQHGSLTKVSEFKNSVEGKYWVTLQNADGFNVECGVLVPSPQKGNVKVVTSPRLRGGAGQDSDATRKLQSVLGSQRYPAILLLGGKATGKYAIDYALDIDSVIILALDYPYEPRDTYTFWTILYDLPAIRKALINMVPSAMLAIDYLTKRSDVDTTKIIMLGYSFGAPFVPVLSSIDRRIAVAAMIYGGGDLTSLIRHNVRRYEGACISEFVGQAGGLFLRPIEPMNYIEKISPIPLVMINGTNDEQVPRINTDKFFNAAKEPKNIIWLESQHVNPDNTELTRRIIAALKKEFRRLKILN